jgi:hypothetical protein
MTLASKLEKLGPEKLSFEGRRSSELSSGRKLDLAYQSHGAKLLLAGKPILSVRVKKSACGTLFPGVLLSSSWPRPIDFLTVNFAFQLRPKHGILWAKLRGKPVRPTASTGFQSLMKSSDFPKT